MTAGTLNSDKRKRIVLAIMAVMLVLGIFVSVFLGQYDISPAQLFWEHQAEPDTLLSPALEPLLLSTCTSLL